MVRSRVFARGQLATRQVAVAAITLALLVMSLPLARIDARAQDEFNAPSVAGVHAEVIAQGIASFTADELAWRLVEDTAEPIGQAASEERALGFAIATDDALLLTDDGTGTRTRLAAGEAAYTAEGTLQQRESLGDAATPYLRIGLVDAGEANNGNGDKVLFGGEVFTGPDGDYEVELVGVKLEEDDSTSVKSVFPMLVVAADGDVSIGGEVLPEGSAMVVDKQADLLAEDGAARVLVALIGSPVPVVAAPPVDDAATPVAEDADGVGRIVVYTELCPVGVTAEQALDTSGADPCFAGGAVAGMTVQVVNTETEEHTSLDIDPSTGMVAFQGLPAGNYNVVFATGAGLGETVGICGGQDSSAGLPAGAVTGGSVNLDLPAEREYLCVTRTLQLGDGDAVITEGALAATFFACPNGMTFETLDPSQCEQITEGFDFGFQGDAGQDLHLSDAEFLEGTFAWSGLTINADPYSGTAYSPIVYAFPQGYEAYAFSTDGGKLQLPHAGGYALTAETPSYTMQVYFINS